jgi:hypothetical protein
VADLSPLAEDGGGSDPATRSARNSDGDPDRAQLLLVGALGIAVLLVVLATVLNSVASAGTLAAGGADPAGAGDAARSGEDLQRGVVRVASSANSEANTSYATLSTALEAGVGDLDDGVGRQAALDGRAASVTVQEQVWHSEIRQPGSRTFTDRGGATDWTLVGDATATDRFRIRVDREGLADSCLADCFTVVAAAGSATWEATIRRGNGSVATESDIVVAVESPVGGPEACVVPDADTAWINLTAGTVGGTDCSALQFAEGVAAPYAIRYENGDRATGSYELAVDHESPADATHYDTDGDGTEEPPLLSPELRAVSVEITHESAALQYRTTVRVRPGDDDA